MASPSITSLPEQTINGFVSKWNASNLPIQYIINNDKSPTGATVTNYYTEVLVYVNGSLVATIKQVPDSDNNTKIDIRKYVQSALSYVYTTGKDSNAFCQFYIEGSENYVDASGITQSNAITGGGSGVVHYGVLASLQFGASYGGNMYNYILDSSKLNTASWMTFFKRGLIIDTDSFVFSIIVNDPGFDLEIIQYDQNGIVLGSDVVAIANNGVGLYRFNLASLVTLLDGLNYITVQALVTVYGTAVSELFYIDADLDCYTFTAQGWNLSTVTFLQYFDASNEITNLRGVFFKPDGLKMYLLGVSNDRIYQYTLSSSWDVSTVTYDSISLDISPKDSAGSDMYFTDDGLKMYFIGSSNDKIYEYDLGTAWNISTGVFNQELSVTSDESVPLGLYFKPTGLKMYICGINGDEINEYDLGTAWDISTAVLNQTKNISAQDTDPRSIFFKPNGLKMYMSGTQNDKVYEYDLSIAWDISTLLFTQSTDISAQGNTPWGLFFNSSGEKMYVAENQNTRVNEYDLTS